MFVGIVCLFMFDAIVFLCNCFLVVYFGCIYLLSWVNALRFYPILGKNDPKSRKFIYPDKQYTFKLLSFVKLKNSHPAFYKQQCAAISLMIGFCLSFNSRHYSLPAKTYKSKLLREEVGFVRAERQTLSDVSFIFVFYC